MKFKIGERVKVRAWDDLVNEFGLSENKYFEEYEIKVGADVFVEPMKELCGQTASVSGYQSNHIFLSDWSCDEAFASEWSYTPEMLESIS